MLAAILCLQFIHSCALLIDPTVDCFVSTYAGQGSAGYADGVGSLARFFYPRGVTVDSSGVAYVADRSNNRIQIFYQDGNFLDQWAQFSRPSGVFVDKNDVLYVAEPGFIGDYLSGGRNIPLRPVVLRQVMPAEGAGIYGDRAAWVRSEALMRLDFGAGRLPGMLVLGAEDPHQFKPTHGTDLLAFFAGVFERTMRRWLS